MVSQEDLLRRRAEKMRQEEEAKAESGVAHGHLEGSAPPDLMEAKGVLHGIFWKYQKELLFLFEMLCNNPYQWQTLRKRVQDIQNEQLMASKGLLTAVWMKQQKENEDAGEG